MPGREHPGLTDDSAAWVEIVKGAPPGAPPCFGSSVILAHVSELIQAGIPLDADNCPKCAQLLGDLA